MDRDEKIGMHVVGVRRPFDKAPPRRRGGDEQLGFGKAGVGKGLLDVLGELKVECVFGNAASAHRAGHLEGMADIDDDAEIRTLATIRLRRGGRALLAMRPMPAGGD